jgi:hypothetical protein
MHINKYGILSLEDRESAVDMTDRIDWDDNLDIFV